MKILLVEPAKSPRTMGGEEVFLFEPLALEYLAAAVRQDHDVRILDLRAGGSLKATLEEHQPDVVGFTAYTVHVKPVLALAGRAKAWRPDVLTVVGGHHATVRPEDFVSADVDLVVSGEGVEPFREIVRRRERGGVFHEIPGVAVREEDRLVATAPEVKLDLDVLPIPARDLTAAYRGRYYCDWMKPLASVRTSKGCPFRCNFCAEWKVSRGRYIRRQPEKVFEELAGIDEECVFFADDESLVDVGRMSRLAQLILEAGLRKRFFLYGRSDTIRRHPELIELWRRAGLERVFVGVEFVGDEDLTFIRKRSTASDNVKAIEILNSLGISVYASFIVRPEFGHDDFAALRDFCHEMSLEFASFAVLTPLPGTDLWDDVHDRMLTEDTDLFDFIHTLLPTALPLEEFYREYSRLYRRAVPLRNQLRLLRRFPLRELPTLAVRSSRIFKRLEALHLDYVHHGKDQG